MVECDILCMHRASDTTYAKQNNGKYEFLIEGTKALPLTKQFWDDLFADAKQWGIILYEQVCQIT